MQALLKYKIILKMIFISAMLNMFNVALSAECELNIVAPKLVFDWGNDTQRVKHTITAYNATYQNHHCKNWTMGVSEGGAGTYNRLLSNGAKTINYNLYKKQHIKNELRLLSDATHEDHTINLNIGNTRQISIYGIIPFPNVGRTHFDGGTYIDQVVLEFTNLETVDVIKAPMDIEIDIPYELSLSLVDTGASFDYYDNEQTLDFGELETNESLAFDLIVRANGAYQVFLSSFNGGALKQESNSDEIKYHLKVANKSFHLDSSGTMIESNAISVTNGQIENRYPLEITIGNTSNKLEGEYSDYITLTVMSSI